MYRLAALLAVTTACASAPQASPPAPRDDRAPAPATPAPSAVRCDELPTHACAAPELGIVQLEHQAGEALAPVAAALPAGTIVATPGRLTRLPLVADAPADGRPLDAHSALFGLALDLRGIGLARTATVRGHVAIDPLPAAVGAAIRLHGHGGDVGDGALVAYGEQGAAHIARAMAHLATLAAPAPDDDGTPRTRLLDAVLAHDVDRDGSRELIVRNRLRGDGYDEAELHVLWADGRHARLDDTTMDGLELRVWSIGPTTSGRTPWFSIALCCGGLEARWTVLTDLVFAPVGVEAADGEPRVCVEDLATAPRLRLEPAPVDSDETADDLD
jgi:hypothetical protein